MALPYSLTLTYAFDFGNQIRFIGRILASRTVRGGTGELHVEFDGLLPTTTSPSLVLKVDDLDRSAQIDLTDELETALCIVSHTDGTQYTSFILSDVDSTEPYNIPVARSVVQSIIDSTPVQGQIILTWMSSAVGTLGAGTFTHGGYGISAGVEPIPAKPIGGYFNPGEIAITGGLILGYVPGTPFGASSLIAGNVNLGGGTSPLIGIPTGATLSAGRAGFGGGGVQPLPPVPIGATMPPGRFNLSGGTQPIAGEEIGAGSFLAGNAAISAGLLNIGVKTTPVGGTITHRYLLTGGVLPMAGKVIGGIVSRGRVSFGGGGILNRTPEGEIGGPRFLQVQTEQGAVVDRPALLDLDLSSRVDLVIPQYDGSTNFRAVISSIIDIAQDELVNPLLEMARAINPDVARDSLLDWLGFRLGYNRPRVPAGKDEAFGFTGPTRARGWDQAPFETVDTRFGSVQPIGDVAFSKLLKGRARRLRGGATREDIESIAITIFGNGYLIEGDEIISRPSQIVGLSVQARPQHFGWEGSAGYGFDQAPFYGSGDDVNWGNVISWSPPVVGADRVTGYKVEVAVGLTGSFAVLVSNTQGTSYIHSGVDPGQWYRYRVSANSTLGSGSFSPEERLLVPGTPASSPTTNAPPIVTVSANSMSLLPTESLQLTATARDPDGTIADTLWSGPGTFSAPTMLATRWNPPTENLFEQIVSLTFSATDNENAVASADLLVTVAGPTLGEDMQIIINTDDDVLFDAAKDDLELLFPRPPGRTLGLVRV